MAYLYIFTIGTVWLHEYIIHRDLSIVKIENGLKNPVDRGNTYVRFYYFQVCLYRHMNVIHGIACVICRTKCHFALKYLWEKACLSTDGMEPDLNWGIYIYWILTFKFSIYMFGVRIYKNIYVQCFKHWVCVDIYTSVLLLLLLYYFAGLKTDRLMEK